MLGLELKIVDGAAAARARGRQRPGLTADEREDARAGDDAATYFMQAYRGMRFTIGAVAFALPWLLIVIDRWLITSEPQIRGSMSAYYHSSARDVFVGGLVATGGFMISYMAAKKRTYDYLLSTIAGYLVIVVAFFPTGRKLDAAGFRVSGDSCDRFSGPPACNGVQAYFGEDVVRVVHQACASGFVVMLAALCVVFALREFGYGPSAEQLCGRRRDVRTVLDEVKARNVSLGAYLVWGVPGQQDAPDGAAPRRRTLLYLAMSAVIVLAIGWAFVGADLPVPFTPYRLGPTYVTEVVAFNAFGVAWIASSKDLGIFRRSSSRVRNVTHRGAAQRSGALT